MKKVIPYIVALTALISVGFTQPNSNNNKQIHVVIDAGHGGSDFGASSILFKEKQIVAAISQKIKALNQNQDVIIHFTREEDEFLSLTDRAKMISDIKPDLVLSLHVNQSANIAKSGMEFYVSNTSKDNDATNTIAKALQEKFKKDNAISATEIKKAPFFILKKSAAPAVLIELGYLSNTADRAMLTDEKQQEKIASTILSFVSELK